MVVHPDADDATANAAADAAAEAAAAEAAEAAAAEAARKQQEHALATHVDAVLCKKLTYATCMEIHAVLNASGDDAPLEVQRQTLIDWCSQLKEANKSISRYARAVTATSDRAEIELHMLKHAVFSDILDREASYTETLEALSSTEPGRDRLAKAMRFVSSVNIGLSTLAGDAPGSTEGTKICGKLRDEAAEASAAKKRKKTV